MRFEAARVGEVGQGFAVVAGEVKSLSSRTGGSTDTVRRRVSDIQSGMSRSMMAIEQLGELIRIMNRVAAPNGCKRPFHLSNPESGNRRLLLATASSRAGIDRPAMTGIKAPPFLNIVPFMNGLARIANHKARTSNYI